MKEEFEIQLLGLEKKIEVETDDILFFDDYEKGKSIIFLKSGEKISGVVLEEKTLSSLAQAGFASFHTEDNLAHVNLNHVEKFKYVKAHPTKDKDVYLPQFKCGGKHSLLYIETDMSFNQLESLKNKVQGLE